MRSEPVVTAQAITAFLSALLVALVALDIIEIDDVQQAAVMAVIVAGVNLAFGFAARAQVTPLANPRAKDGTPLVKRTDYPE